MRLPPQVLVRAADGRPFELQDLLPADTRFKVLLFAGDTTRDAQRARLRALAAAMDAAGGFFNRHTPARGARADVFDILAISSGKKEVVNFTDLPPLFRPHWSKCVFPSEFRGLLSRECAADVGCFHHRVLVDDLEIQGIRGGKAYSSYGISPEHGAFVIVRPDGYVGMVAPLDKAADLDAYFAGFMQSPQ